MLKLRTITFGKWLLVSLLTYALLDVVFVGIAGLALNLSFRSLLLPYVEFLNCGLLLAILMYWTRQSYSRPKSCAARLAFTFFSYVLFFMLALLFSAVRVGIVSQSTALNAYAPYVLPGSAVAGTVVYFMARKRLEALQHGESVPH